MDCSQYVEKNFDVSQVVIFPIKISQKCHSSNVEIWDGQKVGIY